MASKTKPSSQHVLIINTYGGSLLLGAETAKANIVATMEDVGFGSDLQALNFPKVPRYTRRAEWPDKFNVPWRDIDVVAHPPCSAFSVQNQTANKRGLDTGAFACHQSVIDYALQRKARTLTIESVVNAYAVAHDVYEENARRCGYNVTYIMCNSASFAVPQWRERVWVIFHRCAMFYVDLQPKYVTLGAVLNERGTSWKLDGPVAKVWSAVQPLVKSAWPSGRVCAVLEKVYKLEHEPNFENVREKYGITGFETKHVRWIDTKQFASVMLPDVTLAHGKRILNVEEYCAIMGFPRDYKWGAQARKFRVYLSKGVCPPVAAWIMKTVDRNASGWSGKSTREESDFGGIIDLRPKKAEALNAQD